MTAKRRLKRQHFTALVIAGLVIQVAGCTSSQSNRPAGLKFPSMTPWIKKPTASTDSNTPNARIASDQSEIIKAKQKDAPEIQLASFEALAIAEEIALQSEPSTTGVQFSLPELETLAIQNSPTLRQLELSASKASGFRFQAGLSPNPNVGYSAQQLADRGTDQHTLFVEREFVTGNKLAHNQSVLNAMVRGQLREVDVQRNRVSADVRNTYYQLLAARMKERTLFEFTEASRKAVELTDLRKQAKEGSQIDVLQATTQWNQIRLQYQQSQAIAIAQAKALAALVGLDDLTPDEVVGELATAPEQISWEAKLQELRSENPEYRVASANLERALANWRRQSVQMTPNVTVQVGAGTDQGTNSGLINTQISAPLAIHNRNQGNISAAHADYCMAQLELERVDRSLRERVARLSGDYESARAAIERFRNQLLPDIQQTLELANQAYVAGETDFLEVLIIRRTFFELRLQSIDAERDMQLAKSNLENFGFSGSLAPINDNSGDASLRDQAFSQQ